MNILLLDPNIELWPTTPVTRPVFHRLGELSTSLVKGMSPSEQCILAKRNLLLHPKIQL